MDPVCRDTDEVAGYLEHGIDNSGTEAVTGTGEHGMVLGSTGPFALVPGFMAGVRAAHQRFGALVWLGLFIPAIHVAERGFPVGIVRERQFDLRAEVLARTPEARRIFFDDGGTPWLRPHRRKLRAAVIGAGLLGIDLAERLTRSTTLSCALVAGTSSGTAGLRLAARMGAATSTEGIDAVTGADIDVVFDAANAAARAGGASPPKVTVPRG